MVKWRVQSKGDHPAQSYKRLNLINIYVSILKNKIDIDVSEKMSTAIFNILPDNIILDILGYLNVKELCQSGRYLCRSIYLYNVAILCDNTVSKCTVLVCIVKTVCKRVREFTKTNVSNFWRKKITKKLNPIWFKWCLEMQAATIRGSRGRTH